MRRNRILIIAICLVAILSNCSNKSENIKNENHTFKSAVNLDCLLKNFNNAFLSINFGGDTLQFDTVVLYKPEFNHEFYDNIFDSYYFFSFRNTDGRLDFGIKRVGNIFHHEVYFVDYIDGYDYMDESGNLIGDFSFLNQCGLDIYSDSIIKNNYGWTHNIFDDRITGNWEVANVDGISLSLEIGKDTLNLNGKSHSYQKEGKLLNDSNMSTILSIEAVGNNKLLINYDSKFLELNKLE